MFVWYVLSIFACRTLLFLRYGEGGSPRANLFKPYWEDRDSFSDYGKKKLTHQGRIRAIIIRGHRGLLLNQVKPPFWKK